LELIKDYDLDIQYHPGKANVVGDALSQKIQANMMIGHRAGSHRATLHQRHYLEQQIIARLSILILNKTYLSVITTSLTLDMIGFLATGFLLLKSNKEYVLTFKILAQVLGDLFSSKLSIYCKQSYAIQLIKHNIHQLPSLGISWPVE
jgi:hypothetical protein